MARFVLSVGLESPRDPSAGGKTCSTKLELTCLISTKTWLSFYGRLPIVFGLEYASVTTVRGRRSVLLPADIAKVCFLEKVSAAPKLMLKLDVPLVRL